KAHLAIITANILFALNYSMSKSVLWPQAWMSPEGLCVARIASAAVLFSIIVWGFNREKVERKDWGWMALASLFGIGGNQLIFLKGMYYTSPVDAAIIATTGPMLVLIISAILRRERITPLKALGIAIGACGALLVILYGGIQNFGQGHLSGNLMVFTSAFSYACYLIVVKDLMKKYQPMTVMAWIFGASALVLTPLLWDEFLYKTQWSSIEPWTWFTIGFVVVGATWIAYICVARSLRQINATTASIYSYSQPVIASLFAIVRGQDNLDGIKVLSAMLVILGVFLVTRSYSK
ncbi:MAG: DMT family transporter, partial [Mucinivorans sp.]